MTRFAKGDKVRVLRTRVHKYEGTVVGLLPRRIRVEFPHGGYNDTPYIEDFQPERLEKIESSTSSENTKRGN